MFASGLVRLHTSVMVNSSQLSTGSTNAKMKRNFHKLDNVQDRKPTHKDGTGHSNHARDAHMYTQRLRMLTPKRPQPAAHDENAQKTSTARKRLAHHD